MIIAQDSGKSMYTMQRYLEEYYKKFINLAELKNEERPLRLAHYISLETLEKIIKTEEIWLSNPLFMNDYEEVRFVLNQSLRELAKLTSDTSIAKKMGGAERFSKFVENYHEFFRNFEEHFLFDLYIFCLSEYDEVNHPDGRLSMWRGYGANGHGAALVFDTAFLTIIPGSPFLITKVRYESAQQRINFISAATTECLTALSRAESNDQALRVGAWNLFQIILFYSVSSKHPGFREEQEWRVIYLPDRDTHNLFADQKTYLRRANSIEPKLKFKIKPLSIDPQPNWSFDSVLMRIVLGPSHANALARRSAQRMLELLGKSHFGDRIWVSEIPYRAINM